MRYVKFFWVQLKRMLRLAVGVFPTAMLLFACIGLAAYFFFTKGSFAEGKNKYQVGVVGNTDASYLGFGIQAVQTMDSSRFMVDFLELDEEEAKQKVRRGELTTYITVPEDFLDSLIYGRNDVKIAYIQTQGQKGITAYLMEELSKIASKLVISSQSSIYAMQRVFIDHGETQELDQLTDTINLKLIEYVLGRSKLAEMEELGISKGLPIGQYYFCAVLLLYCFLFGICAAAVFFGRDPQLYKWMKMRGIGTAGQVFCEWLPYFLFMLCCIAVPILIAGKATQGFTFLNLSWKIKPWDVLLTILPLTVMISAMQFMLYELLGNPVANLLTQFVLVIGMGYVSGFFLPASFFPDQVIRLGRVLPTGVAMDYFAKVMQGAAPGRFDLRVAVYATLFLLVTLAARCWKIHGES